MDTFKKSQIGKSVETKKSNAVFWGIAVIFILSLIALSSVEAKGLLGFFTSKETRTPQEIYLEASANYSAYAQGSVSLYKSLLEAEMDLAINKGKTNFGIDSSEDIRLAEKIDSLEGELLLLNANHLTPVISFERTNHLGK